MRDLLKILSYYLGNLLTGGDLNIVYNEMRN